VRIGGANKEGGFDACERQDNMLGIAVGGKYVLDPESFLEE
jgi:hypothetical protein